MENLKNEIKNLIIVECDKDVLAQDITDDEILFGEDSNLKLDSLDALQISMALQKKYNVVLTDSKKLRKIMKNINSLASYLKENMNVK